MRQAGLLWGVIAVAVAGVLMADALGLIPPGLQDTLLRAWPALLILIGLAALLQRRMPLGGLVALGVSAAVVINVGVLAFSARAGQQRSDQIAPVAQPVSAAVSLLVLDIRVLATDLDITLAEQAGRAVTGEFVGSLESQIALNYAEDDSGLATLTLTETQPNPFQRLEAVGRGSLRLSVPQGIGLDLVISGAQGRATLNLSEVLLERLNLDLQRGDALITLPSYAPQSPTVRANPDAQTGTLTVREGSLTLVIPQTVAASLALNRGTGAFEPIFDETLYNYLRSDVLENRRFDNAAMIVRYLLNVPRGVIRIEDVPEA